ncbi:MAG: P-II family nitrogen regulator [Dehalococcoidia bacterium]|nr:P-II family nitrogen regulator [Dehalococcoidia bacterium]
MKKIEAIIRPEMLESVKEALAAEGFVGLNIANVVGRGIQKGITHVGRAGEKHTVDMLPKTKLEVVVKDADVERAIRVISGAARTNRIGDGKIFVIPIEDVVRIRTSERGEIAI